MKYVLEKKCNTTFGEFTFKRTSRQLYRNSEEILLSQREYQLLDLLVQNTGNVLNREVKTNISGSFSSYHNQPPKFQVTVNRQSQNSS